jgi:hypothetical protein
MDIISKFNHLYNKEGFFQKYGVELIISSLIIFVFFIATSYFYTLSHIRSLRKDWPQNKCNPIYIPFAGLIIDDPHKSNLETTSENFNFCVNNILSSIISTVLEPIYYFVKLLIEAWKEIITAIQNIRAMFNKIRNSANNVTQDVMNRGLNITTPIIQNTIIARDTLNKTNGVMAAGLFQVFGTYLTLKALIATIIELVIILVLIVVAIATLALYAAAAFTFGATLPAAIAGTIFFIAISVPLAIVIAQIGQKLHVSPSQMIPKVPTG